jgi:hypothetical protein
MYLLTPVQARMNQVIGVGHLASTSKCIYARARARSKSRPSPAGEVLKVGEEISGGGNNRSVESGGEPRSALGTAA